MQVAGYAVLTQGGLEKRRRQGAKIERQLVLQNTKASFGAPPLDTGDYHMFHTGVNSWAGCFELT